MKAPGALLASGRDADIFEYDDGLVLRRSRAGHSMATEAWTMEHARGHGYPVPAVVELSRDGTELVMERVDGPSMLTVLGRRPWTLRRHGQALAELHHRLHEIPAPDWVPAAPGGDGDRLLHLDLHPLNVIISEKGLVVIDWPNAARGDGATDAALTWVLLASGEVPISPVKAAILSQARKAFVNSFLAHFDVAAVKRQLRDVVEWKVRDPHMSPAEQRAMWRLAETA